MGGNLFKLGRLPREQYLEIETDVRAYLDAKIGSELYRIPRYYGDKSDFGDMDVVLSSALERPWDEVRAMILRDLGIERYKITGAVFSTVYHDFQVDYFEKSAAIFLSTYNFLCFNDLGNLLGKMFRRLGLKYGEDGLFWVFRRQNGSYRRDILLSRDYQRIFALLELDAGPWERGFENLETMFRWVIASPYFSVAPFFRRAPTTEKRLALRRTFREFLSFLERENITRTYDYEKDRDHYIPLVAEHFPEVDLPGAVEAERVAEKRVEVIRKKFSGRIIMELYPELRGKELGEFIRLFRAQSDDMDDRLHDATTGEVFAMIHAFASEHLGGKR